VLIRVGPRARFRKTSERKLESLPTLLRKPPGRTAETDRKPTGSLPETDRKLSGR
jgi:hypothetical protein